MRRLISTLVSCVFLAAAWGVVLSGSPTVARGDEGKAENLPAGLVRDRHLLMEEIGGHAKKIGDAVKTGETDGIGEEATALHAASKRVSGAFEKRELHPESRATQEIWTRWESFEADANKFVAASGNLAEATRGGGDVGAAATALFDTCKSCHKAFRAPED